MCGLERATDPSKASFVAEMVKATNAVLGVLEIVVLHKAVSVGSVSGESSREWGHVPFAQTSVVVNDGLRADNLTETRSKLVKKVVSSLRKQTTKVNVGDAVRVLQAAIKRLHG